MNNVNVNVNLMINDKDNNRIYKVYNKIKQAMRADK